MKKIILILYSIIMLFYATSCTKSVKTIVRMQKLEEGVSNPSSVEELQEAIQKYQERVVDLQTATSQIGIWYKMLGTRYLDQNMYGEALESFKKAVEIYPDNQNLYYYIGLCAGFMSHTALDYSASGSNLAKFNYLKLSEDAYLRAIQIEPRYVRALYGLGVLYVFELKQAEKAIPHLELLLTIDTNHIDAMTVLAGAYYATGDYDKAIDMYDRIISHTKSEEKKQMAQENKNIILEKTYDK